MHEERQIKPADFENILNNLDAVVYVADTDTHELLFMNTYALRHIAHADNFSDIAHLPCYEVLQKNQTRPCDFCTNAKLPANGDVLVWEFKNTRNQCWYQCRDRLIDWHDGRRVRLEVATDISERKHAEEALQRAQKELKTLAETDSLTGLYNRRAFFRYVDELLNLRPTPFYFAVILLDIDHFKLLNDRFGHEAGDKLLSAIGKALRSLNNKNSVVARTGGEEFTIAVTGASQDALVAVAHQVQALISDITLNYFDATLSCTASVGIAITNTQSPDISQIMRHADHALYRAKAAGRARTEIAT
ncbi:MAG: GGDEF domain-containing protein [Idiomarinaceae bacterium]|nr:GGDEF domain-containing protein [Idiomarinaceae bacterium]